MLVGQSGITLYIHIVLCTYVRKHVRTYLIAVCCGITLYVHIVLCTCVRKHVRTYLLAVCCVLLLDVLKGVAKAVTQENKAGISLGLARTIYIYRACN